MNYSLDVAGQERLKGFFEKIGSCLLNRTQQASFALYMLGLLGEAPRKSLEPIAAQLCPDPTKVDALHQRLQHFLVDAPWSDRAVRREAAHYALAQMTQRGAVKAWILDDTGFLKQGIHSVGVQRQYTGSAGKVANCQIGVSLTVSTATAHLPLDFELYLPEFWLEEKALRVKARIPAHVSFRTKPQLAIDMLRQAQQDGIPQGVVLADSAFGDNMEFRAQVQDLGLDYAVGIHSPTKVIVIGRCGQRSAPLSARTLADSLSPAQFKKLRWREGTKKPLQARFAFHRVIIPKDPRQEPLWLVTEWPDDDARPSHFYLATLPARTQKQALIRLLKERYRTEQVYAELKGELGLDHYEGAAIPVGTTTFRRSCAASRSWLRNGSGFPPPTPEGRRTPVRSPSRPERHFPNSLPTIRQAVARIMATWLPRCPLCHHHRPSSSCDTSGGQGPPIMLPASCSRGALAGT